MDASSTSEKGSSELNDDNFRYDPKRFKTTLCNYYLQGLCKNGDQCPFAHGTLDLRVTGGKPVAEAASGLEKKNSKTTLCVKFVSNGYCPYGSNCAFAHSVKEVKAALEPNEGKIPFVSTQNFKTVLCQRFISGKFCQFGDHCLYAHGEHELRDKQSSATGYKTKLCKNFEESGSCRYGSVCHFAHGAGELRANTSHDCSEVPPKVQNQQFDAGPAEASPSLHVNLPQPVPSTQGCPHMTPSGACTRLPHCPFQPSIVKVPVMCKFLVQGLVCPRGETYCRYCHSGEELLAAKNSSQNFRTVLCRTWQETGSCKYGDSCRFAHGTQNLRTSRDETKYKVVLCKFFMSAHACPNGDNCTYAHGLQDLRTTRFSQSTSSGTDETLVVAGSKRKIPESGDHLKYKSVLCNAFQSFGECPFGEKCSFAHGEEELTSNKKLKFF